MSNLQPIDTVIISDEELKSLTNAIQQRHGIDFGCYEPKSLKRRVVRALHIFKLNSIHELWIRILKEHAFIYPFMDEISVGLTAMFRDPILWRTLRDLLNENFLNKRSISIWHAGCSSGEEVYTMGIVLRELQSRVTCRAWATDISNQAIATAKKGEYNSMKMEEYERNFKEFSPAGTLRKYFSEKEGVVNMDTTLINHVDFEHHNLITGKYEKKFDIIFCRNVMIYFDNEAKRKLFEKFHASLNPNGLLIIGFYDAVLPMISPDKFSVLNIDAKIFQKVGV